MQISDQNFEKHSNVQPWKFEALFKVTNPRKAEIERQVMAQRIKAEFPDGDSTPDFLTTAVIPGDESRVMIAGAVLCDKKFESDWREACEKIKTMKFDGFELEALEVCRPSFLEIVLLGECQQANRNAHQQRGATEFHAGAVAIPLDEIMGGDDKALGAKLRKAVLDAAEKAKARLGQASKGGKADEPISLGDLAVGKKKGEKDFGPN